MGDDRNNEIFRVILQQACINENCPISNAHYERLSSSDPDKQTDRQTDRQTDPRPSQHNPGIVQ